jgi:two-component system, cell cycle sensor histidine kinase and response regulator CckA
LSPSEARKLEAAGLVAGGFAHDCSNLLTVILGHADELSSLVRDNPEAAEEVRGIQAAAERAAELTRQLLGYLRQKPESRGPVDIHKLIAANELLLRNVLGSRITLSLELCAARPVIHGDSSQLFQVLLNLALNARDAMPSGGDVDICTSSEAAGFTLEFCDSGPGISPDALPRIFDQFFTTKSSPHSTGMGLSVAREIIEQHGGTIAAESIASGGARFVVTIPIAR